MPRGTKIVKVETKITPWTCRAGKHQYVPLSPEEKRVKQVQLKPGRGVCNPPQRNQFEVKVECSECFKRTWKPVTEVSPAASREYRNALIATAFGRKNTAEEINAELEIVES